MHSFIAHTDAVDDMHFLFREDLDHRIDFDKGLNDEMMIEICFKSIGFR